MNQDAINPQAEGSVRMTSTLASAANTIAGHISLFLVSMFRIARAAAEIKGRSVLSRRFHLFSVVGEASCEATSKHGTTSDGGVIAPSPVIFAPPACELHSIRGHPERSERYGWIVRALQKAYVDLKPRDAPCATRDQLELFHIKAHVDKLFGMFEESKRRAANGRKPVLAIDGDTAVMPSTGEAALRAVGASCSAVDEVLSGRATTAFCVIRPPGHHAKPDQAMGFCYFNNAGIAALHARKVHGIRRVACIDPDVHHGNGTQALFENDPELFYASTHQGYGMYPGTGYEAETGVADNVVNVPFKEGAGSTEFRKAYDEKILPKLAAFRPELIIISIGFDAHEEDPLGGLELTDDDFYWVAKRTQDVGRECDAPVISLLEGGYDLRAIADCAVAHMRGLMESPPTRRRPPTATMARPAPAEGGAATLVTGSEAAVEVIEGGEEGLEEVVHGMRVLELGRNEVVVQNGSGFSDMKAEQRMEQVQ